MTCVRLHVVVALSVSLLGPTVVCPRAAARESSAVQSPVPPVWLQRAERWLRAVKQHEPGAEDAEAKQLAAWTRGEMQDVLADVLGLRDALKRAAGHTGGRRTVDFRGEHLDAAEVQGWFGITDDEARRGDINVVLWKGALLHADIAMLVPSDDRPVVGRARVLRVRDGQEDGYEYSVAPIWEFARSLLDARLPDASYDGPVLLWFKATAAYLLQGGFGPAGPHLDRARELFPADADLLFYSGCLHESYSAPALQEAVRTAVAPPGRKFEMASADSHLGNAQRFFRKALEKNPRLIEARVHLGHVLEVQGLHAEAAGELRQAIALLGDALLRYYACMFLGDAEQGLGHRDAARESYERAAASWPSAQSPLFALSRLALAAGDRDGAARALDSLSSAEFDGFDPWATYYISAAREAEALLAELRASAATVGRR